MIRLIVRTDDAGMAAHVGGPVITSYKTFDVNLPEIEALLRGGGSSNNDFSYRVLVGAEVITPELPNDKLAKTAGI